MVTGSISFKQGAAYYTLRFSHHGWLAADLIQYLDEILRADNREVAILKLLGYTLNLSPHGPDRDSDHWVEIDLDHYRLSTNSDLVRMALDGIPPGPEDPYNPNVLKRLRSILDQYDFTVELY